MKKILCLLLSAQACVALAQNYTYSALEMAMIDSDVYDCVSSFIKNPWSCHYLDWHLGNITKKSVVNTTMNSFSYEVKELGKKEALKKYKGKTIHVVGSNPYSAICTIKEQKNEITLDCKDAKDFVIEFERKHFINFAQIKMGTFKPNDYKSPQEAIYYFAVDRASIVKPEHRPCFVREFKKPLMERDYLKCFKAMASYFPKESMKLHESGRLPSERQKQLGF